MSLMAAIIIAFAGLPLAALLFFVGAMMLRAQSPKRSQLVIWSIIALIVAYVGLALLSSLLPYTYSSTLETTALILGAPLATAAVIGAVSLLFPLPDRGAAVGAIVAGLFCLAVATFWYVQLANTNFGL